jgi:DNA polymerase III sliding clamp (beta) subunit (PCNA family)
MEQTLKMVLGGVAKKTMVPILTHVRIYGGRVQGGNGKLSIDAPCPELAGLDLAVPAERLLKAVIACEGEPTFRVTDGGRLVVSRGSFRALLPTLPPENYPLAVPDCGELPALGDWLPALELLDPFVSTDASRPWTTGVWIGPGDWVYATNNTCLARVRNPARVEHGVILPGFALDELIRLGVEPEAATLGERSVTFLLPGGAWLRTSLVEGEWPDVEPMFHPVGAGAVPAAPVLAAARRVRPFCTDDKFPVIVLDEEGVATEEGEMSARVEGFTLPPLRWHADTLELILGVSRLVDFTASPVTWEGDGINGVAMPLRQ